MSLRNKLKQRMDELQTLMESNTHLSDPERVAKVIDSVNYAFHVLDEEDRDYIQVAQDAVEEQTYWSKTNS